MTTYECTLRKQQFYTVIVEANSLDEAKAAAILLWPTNIEVGSLGVEIWSVELIGGPTLFTAPDNPER
jgi:hypothetical protein